MKHPYDVFGEEAMEKAASAWTEMRLRLKWANSQFEDAIANPVPSAMLLLESVTLQIRLCCELYVTAIAALKGVSLDSSDIIKIKSTLDKLFPGTGERISVSIAAAWPIDESHWGSPDVIKWGGDEKTRLVAVAGDASLIGKSDLKKIFRVCGDILHVGKTKSCQCMKADKFLKFQSIGDVIQRLQRLCESSFTYFDDDDGILALRWDDGMNKVVSYHYDNDEIVIFYRNDGQSAELFFKDLIKANFGSVPSVSFIPASSDQGQ